MLFAELPFHFDLLISLPLFIMNAWGTGTELGMFKMIMGCLMVRFATVLSLYELKVRCLVLGALRWYQQQIA